MHSSSDVTSATATVADPPSRSIQAAVSSAAVRTRSAQITDAPSRAARTEIARPLPTGASGSSDGWVPAPTTSRRRSASSGEVTASPLEAGDAWFELHAQRVQAERHQVVLPDDHRDLDELLLVVGAREGCPRLVRDAAVVVELVRSAQQCRVERAPTWRVRSFLDAAQLVVVDPRGA